MQTIAARGYLTFLCGTILVIIGLFFFASYLLIVREVIPSDNLTRSLTLLHSTRSKSAAFGDSRIALDFAPTGEMVNLAYVGETILDMQRRVEIWLTRQPHPRAAFIEADAHLFSEYRAAPAVSSYLKSAPSFLERIVPVDEHHWPLLLSYWYVMLTKGKIGDSKFVFQKSGWEIYHDRFDSLSPSDRNLWAQTRIIGQTPSQGFQESLLAKHYEAMLTELAKRGATMCLITTPVSPPYFEIANKLPQYAEASKFFQTLAQKYHARYVNLFSLFSAPSDIALFADTDHLNEKGARIFSDLVREKCDVGPLDAHR